MSISWQIYHPQEEPISSMYYILQVYEGKVLGEKIYLVLYLHRSITWSLSKLELCLLKDNPRGANADLYRYKILSFQRKKLLDWPPKAANFKHSRELKYLFEDGDEDYFNFTMQYVLCTVLTWKHIVHFQNQKMAPCKSSSKCYRHRNHSKAWSRLRPRNEQWGFYRENDQCALLNCGCMYASLK